MSSNSTFPFFLNYLLPACKEMKSKCLLVKLAEYNNYEVIYYSFKSPRIKKSSVAARGFRCFQLRKAEASAQLY